jgi:hypothetical protein
LIKVQSAGPTDIRLYRMEPGAKYSVTMDGAELTGWTMENGNVEMRIPAPDGEHEFQVTGGSSATGTPPAATQPGEAADGGCGCRMKGRKVSVGMALLAGAALWMGLRRRRRARA